MLLYDTPYSGNIPMYYVHYKTHALPYASDFCWNE